MLSAIMTHYGDLSMFGPELRLCGLAMVMLVADLIMLVADLIMPRRWWLVLAGVAAVGLTIPRRAPKLICATHA